MEYQIVLSPETDIIHQELLPLHDWQVSTNEANTASPRWEMIKDEFARNKNLKVRD